MLQLSLYFTANFHICMDPLMNMKIQLTDYVDFAILIISIFSLITCDIFTRIFLINSHIKYKPDRVNEITTISIIYI